MGHHQSHDYVSGAVAQASQGCACSVWHVYGGDAPSVQGVRLVGTEAPSAGAKLGMVGPTHDHGYRDLPVLEHCRLSLHAPDFCLGTIWGLGATSGGRGIRGATRK